MKYLVVSHQHGLLPWAFRLKREGHEVSTIVWSERYEAAWNGRLDKIATGKPSEKVAALSKLVPAALAGELCVVTDSPRGMELFVGAPLLFGILDSQPWKRPPNLCLVGWFDGEGWHGRRWAVLDWGLWPGGLGAVVLGGCTLVAGERFPAVLEVFTDGLKGLAFKGLVAVGLDYFEAAKELVPTGFIAGWPALITHAWLTSQNGLGELLTGVPPKLDSKPFTVALPVTQPPYPVRGAPGPEPVSLAGLVREHAQHCYFHDIAVRGSEPWTAGLNGLIAVVAASGSSLYSAQQKVLTVAGVLPLPEKQLRPDVGMGANMMIAELERLEFL